MNCKPGDLAVIVRDDTPENVGKLVLVKERGSEWEWDPQPHWACKALGSPVVALVVDDERQPTGFTRLEPEPEIPDADLCPLRHPGDDAVDETLL